MNRSTRWRKLLLTVHIAASVALLGGALTLLTLGSAGLGGADARTVYPAARLVEARVIAPLAVLALLTGVLVMYVGRWSMRRHWWIPVKAAITAVMTVVVFTVLGPALAAIARAATDPAAGPLTDAQRLRGVLFPAVAASLLLFNTALGVYKPGRRRAVVPAPPASDSSAAGARDRSAAYDS